MVQYVLPWIPFVILAVAGLFWPRFATGVAVILAGVVTFYVVRGYANSGELSFLVSFLLLGVIPLAVVSFLFWKGRSPSAPPRSRILRILRPPRRWAGVIAAVLPTITFMSVALANYVDWIQRADDDYRGERTIVGNGVVLTWAGRGPGWPEHGGHSWNEVALYGLPPVGFEGKAAGRDGQCGSGRDRPAGWESGCASQAEFLQYNVCLYLNKEGTALMPERQDIWRMPTIDELVRTLTRKGGNAGCTWNGKTGRQACRVRALRETPLWDPTTNYDGIYLFGDEANASSAYYVYAESTVQVVPKDRQARSHNYRCVRLP